MSGRERETTGAPYATRLDPPPADPSIAHGVRATRLVAEAGAPYRTNDAGGRPQR